MLNKDEKFIIHDLRNSLFQAKACLNIALENQPDLQNNVWLERSNAASQRAHDLLNELLMENTQTVETSAESNKVIWNLQEYIETRAIPDFQFLQNSYSIDVNVSLHPPDKTKYVSLNDATIKRIKDNVIQNSINAKSSVLNVDYEMKDDYYSVTFADNGCGMSSGQLDSLLLKQYKKDEIHGLGTQFITATAQDHNFILSYQS